MYLVLYYLDLYLSICSRVKLEGHDTSLLQITGKVVDGTLELLSHSKEEAINCVEFGSTYYGTDQTECAMLYNNGPESLFFVAVLDEEASGQEVVSGVLS